MNKEQKTYLSQITEIFSAILKQEEVITQAATITAKSIARDELLHIIGPGGHSSMAAEEIFWRAGGLAPVNAILDAGINLIHGAKRTNIMERTPGYAEKVFDAYGLGKTQGEVIIIANAYGINSMTIDSVIEAKKRGLITIGITSKGFCTNISHDHPSRHPSGKNLYEEVDYFIDCHLPYGDAIIEIEGVNQKTGPTSTLCNVFTLNILMIEIVKQLAVMGFDPPLWMSANLPGGDEANKKHFEKFIPRIKHLA